ncbi:TonB-dependent receptor [Mucilaginibacter sp. PAMB04274]|uniref:TonB-dependent receptor n=1 Tax=Mucilaginibacter sp. PAMB04274 TaxID=3138568 RepID=UPI0031F655ED
MKPLLTAIAVILLNSFVHAQDHKGLISGKITDAQNQPLSYVVLSLKGTPYETTTNEKGNYLLKIPTSRYTVLAKLMGYLPVERNINVTDGKSINIPFTLLRDSSLLKEVIVSGVKVKSATATRMVTQIQDIPQAITVIGQKTINQQAAFDLPTITRNISGLNFTGSYAGTGSSQFFNARGFDLNDAQNYRLNGSMIWNWGNNYADNIEQVEFLKGPTSILFGDVAPGGVLNFVTKKPLATFMANLNFKTGSWGLLRPALDITGPLNSARSLRFRLNTSFERSDSFRDFVSSERAFIAPALAWDITPKLSVNVEAVFKKSKSTDDAGLVSPDGTIEGLKKLSSSLYLGEPSRKYLYNDQSYLTTISYELGKTWRLKATGFYGHSTNRPFGMWFDQPDENGDFQRREYDFYQKANNGTISADVNGTFYTGTLKHNLLVGFEYQSTHYRYTYAGALIPFDINNIYAPVYGVTPSPEPATFPYRPYESIIARSGIYLQDQVMFFNEKLHLLLGLRAGKTRQGNHYYQDELPGTVYEGYTDNIISKNVLTPRVGLVYKPQTWISYYGSYSKGFEINSPDIFATNFEQYATPPATSSTQVEFGTKANLLNNSLGVTLSIYEINKHNPYGYVYLDAVNPNYDEYNVYYQGHHRSCGVELDMDGKLSPALSITAGAAYTQTRVIEDPGYPTGNRLPNAPKYTANGWLNYEPVKLLKGFNFGAGVFYKDSFFSSLTNDANLKIPASYTVDVAAGYKFKQISAQLNVMNLTNQVSYLNPWQFNLFDVRPLRQFVVTLNYRISK